jgi:hypothetical protein
MTDAYERRALLLHLGDVLEAVSCVVSCGDDQQAVDQLVAEHELLEAFPLLTQVSVGMRAREFAQRAISAFCSWPQELLEAELDRDVLATTVKRSLFPGNATGWHAYLATLQKEVSWFGRGIQLVEAVQDSGQTTADFRGGDAEIVALDEPSSIADIEREDVGRVAGRRESVESAPGLYPSWPWKPEL